MTEDIFTGQALFNYAVGSQWVERLIRELGFVDDDNDGVERAVVSYLITTFRIREAVNHKNVVICVWQQDKGSESTKAYLRCWYCSVASADVFYVSRCIIDLLSTSLAQRWQPTQAAGELSYMLEKARSQQKLHCAKTYSSSAPVHE